MDKEVVRAGTEEVQDSQDDVDGTPSGSNHAGFRAPKVGLIRMWSGCGDSGGFPSKVWPIGNKEALKAFRLGRLR
jgi:hypothetical protein